MAAEMMRDDGGDIPSILERHQWELGLGLGLGFRGTSMYTTSKIHT
jgi:hypothetical protein